jgi:hypothetical protein
MEPVVEMQTGFRKSRLSVDYESAFRFSCLIATPAIKIYIVRSNCLKSLFFIVFGVYLVRK